MGRKPRLDPRRAGRPVQAPEGPRAGPGEGGHLRDVGEVPLQVPHFPSLCQVLAQIKPLFEGVQRLPSSGTSLSVCPELSMDLVHAPGELPEFSGGTVGTLRPLDGRGHQVSVQTRQVPQPRTPLLTGCC